MKFIEQQSRSRLASAFFSLENHLHFTLVMLPLLFVLSCGVSKKIPKDEVQLTYLDDINIDNTPDSLHFGGISGIDFINDTLFMVSDSGREPKIFFSKLEANKREIELSTPELLLDLRAPDGQYFDLESIRKLDNQRGFLISSEGNIKKNIETSIFKTDQNGDILKNYQLPEEYLIKNNKSEVFHNRGIEAMTFNEDKTGFWFSTEFPLRSEGKPPKLFKSGAAQQFLFYDLKRGRIATQFDYQLDPIPKIPLLPYSLNGLTGMLMISPNQMITIERGFSAGWGKHSNRVKLFLVQSDEKLGKAKSVNKFLLLDLKKIKKQLNTDRIDNIEGICFGPQLEDGNKSIFLISDDNFSAYGDQITQLIWLKLER